MKRIAVLIPLLPCAAMAAGFIDHLNGVPYKWKTFPITYRLDPGALGSIPHGVAATLVQSSFDAWKNVSVASVDFAQGTDLPADVTTANASQYVVLEESSGVPRPATLTTAIIFDSNGSIIDMLFGAGASNTTLGVASAGQFDDANQEVKAGVAIISGKNVTATEVQATMTHEFGHLLNLAHTQLNFDELLDGNAANDDVVPTMSVFQFSDPQQAWTPEADDRWALAYLYPNSVALQTRGTVEGHIIRRTGAPVRGVNVTCRNQASPKLVAVSWISDQVLEGNGEYLCGNLAAGSYTVSIEPIFVAINLFSPDPPFVVPEFYSGATESYDPPIDPSSLTLGETTTPVAVSAGSTTPDIDFTLNEDGRLTSDVTVVGTTEIGFPLLAYNPIIGHSPLDYFITVPASASGLRLELHAEDPSVDLDLLARCDSEFSLPAGLASAPLTSDLVGSGAQAEVEMRGPTGDESFELTGSTNPGLRACTYHLLVVNYDGSSTDANYTLTATIEGADPTLAFRDVSRQDGLGSGETMVFAQLLEARDDTFRVRSITYTDSGIDDLSSVSQAKLYMDDGDGQFSASQDRLLSTAAVDSTFRTLTFSGFDELIPDGSQKMIYVTYVFPIQARVSPWIWILGLGVLVSVFSARRRRLPHLLIFLIMASFLSCGGPAGYKPGIESDADVQVTGLTFGSNISLSLTAPGSVKEFFDQ